MSRIKITIVFFAVIPIFSSSADANRVFKCFGERVDKGDSTYSVFKKCGEPVYKEILSSEGCDKVEKWHYDCYGRGYVEEIIFEKGILADQNRGEISTGTQSCNSHGQFNSM